MRLIRRLTSGVSVVTLAVAALVPLTTTAVAHATGLTCTWIGPTSATDLNNAAYWSNCNSGVPGAGDVISLAAGTGTSTYTLTNDLPGNPALGGITVNTYTDLTDYSLFTVNSLHFGDAAVITTTSGGITVTGSVTADGSLAFNGQPKFAPGNSNVTVNFTNATYTNAPESCGGAAGGAGSVFSWQPSGTVTIGSGSMYIMTGTESAIDVQSGGVVQLPYSSNPVTYGGNITFEGGGTTQGTVCSESYSLGSAGTNTTLTGTITMNGGDIDYNIPYGTTLTVTGNLEGSGSSLKAAASSAGTFVNNAATNNSSTPGGSAAPSVKTLPAITDSQPSVNLDVASNTIVTLDGARGDVTVEPGGTLKGIGTAGSLDVVDKGTVAPGHSPGTLTILKTLFMGGGSTYQAELKDAKPGDYDQMIVGSPSDTGSDVTLGDTTSSDYPTLDASLYSGASIKAGDMFTIIDNKGQGPVAGQFASLPEGATFKVGNGTMKISYKGGDGNDVVLTALSSIGAPDTGVALAAAHPAATFGVSLLAAGAIFGLAHLRNRKPIAVRVRAKTGRR